VAIFPLLLKDSAIDWFDSMSREVKATSETLLNNFNTYFGKTEMDYVFAEESVFTRVQRPREKVTDYIAQMQKLAKRIPNLQDGILLWVILRGLRPQIKANVIQMRGGINSVADILEHAKLVESAGLGNEDDSSDAAKMTHLMEEIRAGRDEVQQLTARLAKMSITSAQARSPTPERRQPKVSFQVPNTNNRFQRYNGPPSQFRGGRAFRGQWRSNVSNNNRPYDQQGSGTQFPTCGRCGPSHAMNRCPAINVTCFACGKRGHLRARCRSARRGVVSISE